MAKHSPYPRSRPSAAAVGRFRVFLVVALAALVGSACRPAGMAPSPTPAPAELEGPALAANGVDATEEERREAAVLLAEAERALEEGDAREAVTRTEEIQGELSHVPGTARALWIGARAHRELAEWEEADATIRRFLEVVPTTDPLHPRAALLLAEVRIEGARPGDVEALFGVPVEAPEEVLVGAEALAAELAGDLDLATLRELVVSAPRHPRILPPFLTELAVRRTLMGNLEEGRELAEEALALNPGSAVAERARLVLEGRAGELAGETLVLGALLSDGGPPSLRELSDQIRAGIEIALLEAQEAGTPARLEMLDHGGSAARAGELVAQLESEGVVGVIGPLVDDGVLSAVNARRTPLPLLSPTARMLPAGASDVFSLTGVEPSAARTLARAAVDEGVRDLVVLHPDTPAYRQEAEFLVTAFEEAGGTVRRVLTYAPGTTNFGEPFGEVVSLRPSGLALLLPVDHIELVAPQVAYFGVDDMEITILGNEAWSSEEVLESVDTRHTDGVISVTSRGGEGEYGPRWETFVERFESHFQRTLRSPVPALGYDAARLLLYAAAQGDGTAEGTAEALGSIADFPGATGTFEVVDGRIQRRYRPVRIRNRGTVPLGL